METSVARLSLGAGASAGNLLEGWVETFANQRLGRIYPQEGDQTIFQLLTQDSWSNILWFFSNNTIPNWDLHLSPKMPLDL